MTIYLLTPDPSTKQIETIEAKLRGLIPELRKLDNVQEIITEISGKVSGKIIPELRKIGNMKEMAAEVGGKPGQRAIIIFVSPVLAKGGIESLLNIARSYRERAFFILISDEISAIDYKRLIGSGGADWVATDGSLQEIPEIIYKQTARAARESDASKSNQKPTVIPFLPSVGGVGNTTIALEVALHIKVAKATRSWKVCYVDLDFQTSHVCDFLDIEARLQIQEIFDQPERLDEQLFELFVSHHSSGLDIFAAPRTKLDPCGINVAALDALLEMILEKYDFIVLDLPVPWFSWTVPTLENSRAVIVTGINTIPCLRQMRATLDAINDAKTSSVQIAVVMNRVTRRFGKIARHKHVESVLAGQNIFYVREDKYAIERVNTGTPAALGGPNRHVQDYIELASFCAKLRLG